MSPWKQLALSAYYRTAVPWRAWANTRRAAAGRSPVMVLFYHRVADDMANAWTMSTATFAQQIRWLKKHFDLVSLEEAQRRIRSGNHRPAVSITFDDGYADNCSFALPLLIKERIPCTYFVTADNVLRGKFFPHDLAQGNRFRPNTVEELRVLASAGIEIGAHTRTHADLGQIRDRKRLRDEVITAGEEIQSAIRKPVRYFAFPFGLHANLNAAAFQLADEAGYEAVCSAYGGYNFPGEDTFHLQRIHGDDQMARLKNWLSVDPRKVAKTQRFDYGAVAVRDAVHGEAVR